MVMFPGQGRGTNPRDLAGRNRLWAADIALGCRFRITTADIAERLACVLRGRVAGRLERRGFLGHTVDCINHGPSHSFLRRGQPHAAPVPVARKSLVVESQLRFVAARLLGLLGDRPSQAMLLHHLSYRGSLSSE